MAENDQSKLVSGIMVALGALMIYLLVLLVCVIGLWIFMLAKGIFVALTRT